MSQIQTGFINWDKSNSNKFNEIHVKNNVNWKCLILFPERSSLLVKSEKAREIRLKKYCKSLITIFYQIY